VKVKNTILFFLFFLSGFTGLVYETLWIRQFGFILGNTTYALSAVFGAYLTGLAVGSFVIGKRLQNTANPVRVYAVLEIGIAVSCFALHILFNTLLKDIGAIGIANSENWFLILQRFLLSFLVLFIPTFLMGGTLPVLSRYFYAALKKEGLTIGTLYGINTIGAALGCFATGFFFIRLFGLDKTSRLAISLSLLIGLVSFILALLPHQQSVHKQLPPQKLKTARMPVIRFLIPAFILSGFTSFSYEVLYSRLLAFVLGNRIFASTAMITIFILGIAIGSFIVAKFLDKTEKEPFIFSITQLFIGITTFLTIVFFQHILVFFQHLEQSIQPQTHWGFILLRFSQAAVIMFLPTIGFGIIFPTVTRYLYKQARSISLSIGKAYALNTIGSITGIFVTTFVLIPIFGAYDSMLMIALISVLLGHRFLTTQWSDASRLRQRLSVTISLALVIVMFVTGHSFKNYPWPRQDKELIFSYEDASSLVTIYKGELGLYHYSDNTMVTFPVGKTGANKVQKIQGHLPVLLHPNPENALVIGLGYGITTAAVTAFDSLAYSETVEIFPGVIHSAPFFKEFNNDLVHNPKSKIYAGDGRYFVKETREKYDIIISNVNEADTPGSASCYTKDYYELLKTVLKPGGLVAVHMYGDYGRLQIKTLQQVFPYLEGFLAYNQTLLMIASNEPISIDEQRIKNRISANPVLRQDLEISDLLSFQDVKQRHVLSNAAVQQIARDESIPVITDDLPILEYAFNPDKPDIFLSTY